MSDTKNRPRLIGLNSRRKIDNVASFSAALAAILIVFSSPAESVSSLAQNAQSALGIEPKGRTLELLETLPAPPPAPAGMSTTPCQNTPLQFSNQDARRNWVRSGMTRILIFWAAAHDGQRAGDISTRCTDMKYASKRLQEALGYKPTGVIGDAEIQAIDRADSKKVLDLSRYMFDRTLSKGGTLEEQEQFDLKWLTGPIVARTTNASPARAPEAKKTDSPTPTFYDLDSSWRRNQNAVAKTIDIFDLRFGITIDDAWAQLPQALCTRHGNTISCRKDSGCLSEIRDLQAEFSYRANPSAQAKIAELRKSLAECESDRDRSSFRKSNITAFAHTTTSATFKFEGQQLQGVSAHVDDEKSFRNTASARFGRPEIQSKTSTYTSRIYLGTDIDCDHTDTMFGVCNPTGRTTTETPIYETQSHTSVRQSYIWTTPGFDIVESGGAVDLIRKRSTAR